MKLTTVTVTKVRNDNGRTAFTTKEHAEEFYTSPGLDPSFVIRPNDRLNVAFHRPSDFITKESLPYLVADLIERTE